MYPKSVSARKSAVKKTKRKADVPRVCWRCGRNGCVDPLDKHHLFGGALRKKSEQYGLVVYLCNNRCHENGTEAAPVGGPPIESIPIVAAPEDFENEKIEAALLECANVIEDCTVTWYTSDTCNKQPGDPAYGITYSGLTWNPRR